MFPKLDPTSVTTSVVAALLLLGIPIAAPQLAGTDAAEDQSHKPANKAGVSSSTIEFMSGPLTANGSASVADSILGVEMRTSNPQDLVLQVTLECALWTQVATQGNGVSESTARVMVWVEMDGEPVKVSSDESGEDAGKVVFCDRTHRQSVVDLDDEDARIEQYLRTRTANAFNWIVVDAGSGVHDFVVHAELDTEVSSDASGAMAEAGIGKRTLVIEPIHLPNDVTI